MSAWPALYDCVVLHDRLEGSRYRFRHRLRLWLVDLDDPPRPRLPLRLLWSFRPADHLGDPALSIAANLRAFLRLHGADVPGGRLLMLAQARSLGFVFDPVTLYWCYEASGALRHVVAETRNTFGERHCYLLIPDARGRAEVPKDFYVSPLFPVDGRYVMRFRLEEERVAVTMLLKRPDGPRSDSEHLAFRASLHGRRRRSGPWAVVAARPLASYLVMAGIHYRSLRLRRLGLPLRRRRPHLPQPGVDRPGAGR